jgi:hypothetical protein
MSTTKSNYCDAWGDMRVWCRGCGGIDKRKALKKYYSDEQVEAIYKHQLAGCDEPFAPCFLCNRQGLYGYNKISNMWDCYPFTNFPQSTLIS